MQIFCHIGDKLLVLRAQFSRQTEMEVHIWEKKKKKKTSGIDT